MKAYGPFLVGLISLFLTACSSTNTDRIQTDPLKGDMFYLQTQFIMLDEEIDIYKNLPDSESRTQFQSDFWKRRDPDPYTEENEFKKEFEDRITYANRWFREPRRPQQGWDTERGRILLALGQPNKREWGSFVDSENYRLAGVRSTGSMERWEYLDYEMVLFFADESGFGDFRLLQPPAQLMSSMELAKSTYLMSQVERKNRITFHAVFRDDKLFVTVPVTRATFIPEDGKMKAKLAVSIVIYVDFRKQESKSEVLEILETEAEILKMKELEISIPLQLKEGRNLLDISVNDVLSKNAARRFLTLKK